MASNSRWHPIRLLRKIGLWEGLSFLLLLAVAMPLKYIWGKPEAVKVVGSAHGALFVIYCLALTRVMLAAKWPLSRGIMAFVASIVPFGPFLIDKRLRQYEAEFDQHQS